MRFLLSIITILLCGSLMSQTVPCGALDDRTPAQIEVDEALYRKNLQTARSSRAYNDDKIIPVVINVLHSGNYAYQGLGDRPSEVQINTMMSQLNNYYESGLNSASQSDAQNDAGFTFVLADKDINGNPMVGFREYNLQDYPEFSNCIFKTYNYVTANCDDGMSSFFGYERDYYLNIFFLAVQEESNGGVYGGWAKYPPSSYGLFINPLSSGWGQTATHEVGHYLGLRHTFDQYDEAICATINETDCETQGDRVCDTGPTIRSFLCVNLCNNPLEDPENFMSYAGCSHQKFTDGQIERMHIQAETFRQDEIGHGQFLYGTTSGCTDPTKCNYDPNALTDDGSCLDNDALGVCGGTCAADVDSDGICDDVDTCLTGDDVDNDGICDSIDPCIGIPDLDNDGICDPDDPCVGTLDACNVCNGPGAIYECGCADIPEGDCDCNGNQLDALGVCGGPCLADLDGDGICDNQQANACAGVSTVSYNGLDYSLIELGNQCWFNSNLATNRFNDGSLIQKVNTPEDWMIQSGNAVPVIGYVDHDNVANTATYGALYNWYAVSDPRGLCPTGYHVPTDKEWMELERYLGLEENLVTREGYGSSPSNVGAKLGDGGNSGFDSKYAGLLVESDGSQRDLQKAAYFWTSTEYKNVFESERNNAWFRAIYKNLSGVGRYNEAWQTANNKGNGMSVRCLKD